MKELTARQRQIADLVAAGKTEREIAAQLRLSVHTVRTHKNTVYAKLDVRNAVEMANALWKVDTA